MLSKYRAEFAANELTVIPNVLPLESIKKVVEAILAARPSEELDFDLEPDAESLTLGGITRYSGFDYSATLKAAPVVQGWYEAFLPLVREVTQKDAILSPYYESRVSTLVYRDNEGQQEYHYDTQPITALLYLTDNPTCGSTTVHTDAGVVVQFPVAASLLIMSGKKYLHSGDAVTTGVKVAMPFNYYTTNDTWRPATLAAPGYWDTRKKRIKG